MAKRRIQGTEFAHLFNRFDMLMFTRKIACILIFNCLISCSTQNASGHTTDTNIDPYQNYNRNAYRMNDKLDKIIVRPVAVWYIDYVPYPVRNTIANFYNNLRDFVTLGNDILQFQGQSSMKNLMRISINSIFGIAGLIDISTSLGLPQNKNSFGNTLKFYGWKHSNYFVIPILGPSTVRDAIGMIPDTAFNPTWYIDYPYYISIGLFAVNGINTRTQFLAFDQILNTSVDPYITIRDVYLANIGESVPLTTNQNEESIDTILEEDIKESKATAAPKSRAKTSISTESGTSSTTIKDKH